MIFLFYKYEIAEHRHTPSRSSETCADWVYHIKKTWTHYHAQDLNPGPLTLQSILYTAKVEYMEVIFERRPNSREITSIGNDEQKLVLTLKKEF